MGEEEREGLIALHSFCFFFRGSEPCRSQHEAHPSEAGSGWLQPLVGAAKCESEQPEQRTTCQAAMAGGKAPRQKPGLHGPRQHFARSPLPGRAPCCKAAADRGSAPRAQGPSVKPLVPFLGTRPRGAEGGHETTTQACEAFLQPSSWGRPLADPPLPAGPGRGEMLPPPGTRYQQQVLCPPHFQLLPGLSVILGDLNFALISQIIFLGGCCFSFYSLFNLLLFPSELEFVI